MATSSPDIGDVARRRLADLRHVGTLRDADVTARGLSLIESEHGAEASDAQVHVYLAVDSGGTVRELRFRSPATGMALLAFDLMCELALGRRMADVTTISPDRVRRLAEAMGIPSDVAADLARGGDQPYYVLVKAAQRWRASVGEPEPAADAAAATPTVGVLARELPWTDIGLFEKVRRIEGVLDGHVRAALASDGGGIDLVDLRDDDLHVQYHGACGSCSSSIGGTLSFIQDTLNAQLGTQLKVIVQQDDESAPSFT